MDNKEKKVLEEAKLLLYPTPNCVEYYQTVKATADEVVQKIFEAMSDYVPVVRCKDCRWFENDGYHTNCQIIRFCVEAEDYCSKGERKDDLISRQAAIDAADDMVEPQESEDKE